MNFTLVFHPDKCCAKVVDKGPQAVSFSSERTFKWSSQVGAVVRGPFPSCICFSREAYSFTIVSAVGPRGCMGYLTVPSRLDTLTTRSRIQVLRDHAPVEAFEQADMSSEHSSSLCLNARRALTWACRMGRYRQRATPSPSRKDDRQAATQQQQK